MQNKALIFLQVFLIAILLTTCNSDDDQSNTPNVPVFEFEVTDFSPKEGLEGTEIKINGNNFGSNVEDVQITLNNVIAKITEVSNSQIKVIAPKNNRGVEAELKISIKSETNTPNEKFLYPVPVIDDFNPKISVLFKDIVIRGSYFSNDPNDVKVTINNTTFPVMKSTLDSVVFQTNIRDLDFLMHSFPISLEIEGSTVKSTEDFTFGAQFKVNDDGINNNYNSNIPICPGSGLNININDNRTAGNLGGSTVTNEDPIFFIGNIQAPVLFNTSSDNGGRDWFIDIPTNADLETTKISVQVNGINLILEESDQIEIGEGSFKLESNTLNKFNSINIELSHIFRKPREIIVKFTNTVDNSVLDGIILNDSFSSDFTKTNLVVSALDQVGSYNVSVSTSDGVYELKSNGNALLELID